MVSLEYDPMEVPLYHGGFADVWKGTSQGREVAVKVLRIRSRSEFNRAKRVGCRSCPRPVVGVDELTVTCVEILHGGRDVEIFPPSKHTPVAWGDHERNPVGDGLRVDDERERK